ncbi:MAG TPA: hypothetical protein ENJ00_10395 [Phycisphaerales bacterium]|nr:hypothetical protein [Phycisphaerales bacterium]
MNRSPRCTEVRARFGLGLGRGADAAREREIFARARRSARTINSALKPGGIALITGPSGAGKSLILAHLASLCERVVLPPVVSKHRRRAVIDLFAMPVHESLSLLASAGLADANIFVTPAGSLSEGQRARLSLALAIEQAERARAPVTILADEFASTLDRTTAGALSGCYRRRLRSPVRLVVASAHDDLLEPLAPDLLVYVPLEGAAEVIARTEPCQKSVARPSRCSVDSGASTRRAPGRCASARDRDRTTSTSPDSITAPDRRRPPPRSSEHRTRPPKNSSA